MPLRQTFEISRKSRKNIWGETVFDVHTIEYKLGPKPYTLLNRCQLPKTYEVDDWESEDDLYFRKDGQLYNLKEFCTHGERKISGPLGGAQIACNGYFKIAGYNGKVYPVITIETKPIPCTY